MDIVAMSIGLESFMDCYNLTSVSLPKATTIGTYAFEQCGSFSASSLTMTLGTNNGSVVITWGSNVFSNIKTNADIILGTETIQDATFTLTPPAVGNSITGAFKSSPASTNFYNQSKP